MTFPPGLNDRARDAWEALFAIADVAGGGWPERARCACESVQANTDNETGAREQLLADLRKVFRDAGDPPSMPTGKYGEAHGNAIIPALCAMEDRPWSEWRDKPLTPRGLATLLKPFGITPGTIRLPGGSTPKGYKREALESAWQLYLPEGEGSLSATTPQPSSNKRLRDFPSATGPRGVADTGTQNPAFGKDCGVVADSNPVPRERNGVNGHNGSLQELFADGDEQITILKYDGEMSPAVTERMAERLYGLEPGTLPGGRTRP